MTTYTAIEAIVKKGKIYPLEPSKLPKEGKVLLIIFNEIKVKIDKDRICSLLGWLKTELDSVKWQKQIRSEWENRT